ncbi:hypothetical protein AC579_7237 [Pseudocercospora musae]|uniref:Ketoreductase (KR) domain-containing protein n=1 Tax=Pseudocercospora musae TaxID=113226 RepID=A0A139IF40_9PEZI|nr:hypothetical protein AC579_7237 [Pseudocercospora musae]
MAIYIAAQALFDGIDSVPYLWSLLKTLPWLFVFWLVKTYFQGAKTLAERNMHGKVVIVTGGTSGVGEATVRALATRGAQIVLLTQHSLSDPFIVDFIEDMRHETSNELITAEQVDLASLHSIRTFATKWIDNAPPRRLDMVILCATAITPAGSKMASTKEGVEVNWMVNYLANFHLLSILSPALRAQPPDRDVRVIFGMCGSWVGGDLLHITQPVEASKRGKKNTASKQRPTRVSPGNAYATSKLALMSFALAFQKHLSSYQRPDKAPMNAKVLLADPGFCRTPGTRQWLSRGSLLGLLIYLLTYPLWLLVLKSPEMGAQSFLHAAMEEFKEGGFLIKECKERQFGMQDVLDGEQQKRLWKYSEDMVQETEKRGKEIRDQEKREHLDKKEEKQAEAEIREYKEKMGKKGKTRG